MSVIPCVVACLSVIKTMPSAKCRSANMCWSHFRPTLWPSIVFLMTKSITMRNRNGERCILKVRMCYVQDLPLRKPVCFSQSVRLILFMSLCSSTLQNTLPDTDSSVILRQLLQLSSGTPREFPIPLGKLTIQPFRLNPQSTWIAVTFKASNKPRKEDAVAHNFYRPIV